MNSALNDNRFSRAFSDPRFRPMPILQKKVKIDKRFKAVLSSKDYGHRVLLDKRGRPIHDVSKRGKHEMERYYQISSDDSSSDDDENDSDDDNDVESVEIEAKVSDDAELSEADSDSFVEKPSLKTKEVKVAKSKKLSKKRKRDDQENALNLKCNKNIAVKKKSSLSKKRSVTDEEEEIEEKIPVKELKKRQNEISGKNKLSSSKKRPLEVCDDEGDERFKMDARFAAKRQRRRHGISDDEEDTDEDDEDMYEEEEDDTSSESEESSSEEEGSSEEEVDTSQCVPVMKKASTVEHSWNELHKNAPIVSDSTHRLAVCNMDWDFVKAQDLFVLFKSFVGEGGSVRSVTIYPSEFGKERIAEDATLGPREMRGNAVEVGSQSSSEEDEDEDDKKKRKKNRRIDSEILKRKAREEARVANEALRGYQLNRLRYYFAVVDCSSVDAADAIYQECDGMEYQLSSITLDLRYIPDDMTFDDPPKDSFSDEQGLVDFKPSYFNSTALSQGKVNVTWDETEFDRIRNKITNAQREELEQIVEDNQYADTIAPPESDSDIDEDERPQWLRTALGVDDDEGEAINEEKKISLYRKVLMDKLVEDKEKEEKGSEVDKELAWTSGLKTAYETKLKRSEKIKEESQGVVVDNYLERRREKRRKRLQKKTEMAKGESDEENGEEMDFNGNDMPDIIDDSLKEMMKGEGYDVNSIKKKKKVEKKKKGEKETQDNSEAEREKAELELLLMRDDDEKRIAKPEKVKEKLSRRQKKKISMQKSEKRKERREGRLTLDVEDERFGAMFTSHHFHIDPNHGQFRKTKNNMKLVDEQIKRMSKAKKNNSSKHIGNVEEVEDSRSVSKKLVESLKSKMKK